MVNGIGTTKDAKSVQTTSSSTTLVDAFLSQTNATLSTDQDSVSHATKVIDWWLASVKSLLSKNHQTSAAINGTGIINNANSVLNTLFSTTMESVHLYPTNARPTTLADSV